MILADEQNQLLLELVSHAITSFGLDVSELLTRDNVDKAKHMMDSPLFQGLVKIQLRKLGAL